ncbi:glycoside hydrolase family 15 protein [Microbacterium mangrovi]|uniref:glycoside hydrolase family 15 protein n=1 Tax=Microbacterium mangrovi TaxID=1348253 RepID=UPI0006899439|nr:glycoside hydrolase family 15 protein [Microbacterium mangrovi]
MVTPIEDYALLSDCRTAALVSREGSIDWLCVPRFDSPSAFGALLGGPDQGRWSLRPADPAATATRRYDGDTFLLITRWETATGVAEVHDVMPVDGHRHDVTRRIDVLRRVVGVSGEVVFDHELRVRFDYARALPWMRQTGTHAAPELTAIAGPDALVVRGAAFRADDHRHRGQVIVAAGEQVDISLTWHPSHRKAPEALDADAARAETREWWQDWAARIDHNGPFEASVVRSLLVLRALSHRDTGGIVAAPTTSLPEQFGGARNWDYRYVWLRDAALTLQALLEHGFVGVAHHWREWLLRAIAGDAADMQIMYGIGGERELPEHEMPSLPGYDGASPVRVGNDASGQYQADVVGEVMVALAAARDAGLEESHYSWPMERALLRETGDRLEEPDNGIWEIRGEPRHFTHSRVMMWAAFDRGIRAVEEHGLKGPVDQWRRRRDTLRAQIDEHGVAEGRFVQHDATTEVDASLLLIPQVGYCAADDPRMLATVAEIERTLLRDGLVRRYRTDTGVDGLEGDEHPFLACSFWLVQQYAASGRRDDAVALMERLCGLANDVGLLSEEYDVEQHRHVGNTPQAFSHLALVRAADALGVHRDARPVSRSAPRGA